MNHSWEAANQGKFSRSVGSNFTLPANTTHEFFLVQADAAGWVQEGAEVELNLIFNQPVSAQAAPIHGPICVEDPHDYQSEVGAGFSTARAYQGSAAGFEVTGSAAGWIHFGTDVYGEARLRGPNGTVWESGPLRASSTFYRFDALPAGEYVLEVPTLVGTRAFASLALVDFFPS